MSKRNFLNSPRLLELKRSRRIIFLRKIILLIIALSAFLSMGVYAYRLTSFNIHAVSVVGYEVSDNEAIKALVEKKIKGNYLWLFPKTNTFFYPKNIIKKELYDKFKGLKNIAFSIKSGNTLELSLSGRSASYIWCGAVPPGIETTENDKKCYFVDKDGYIFDEAAYFSGDVYFKFYGETASDSGTPSGTYFSGQNFGKLISLNETVENMGLKPVAIYLDKNEDIKLFLAGGAESFGPQLIFKMDSDFKKAAENLEAAITTEPLLSDFKKKYSSLLYIDLRYGNKVYYKFSTPGGN